jgi:precorrin-2 dehydrogenase / sirohydrochlorin ferrochelatase
VTYPVALDLAGRRCVVVGGGAVAARKVRGLLAAGAAVTVVAPEVGDAVRNAGVEVHARGYRSDDLAGAWLVVAATDDPAVNDAVARDCGAAGVLVNRADDGAGGSVSLPAVRSWAGTVLTVSTGGHSPAFARWLADHLAAVPGPSAGEGG